jgi:hypothetical protein
MGDPEANVSDELTNEEMDAKVLESIRSGTLRASGIQADLKLGPAPWAMRAVDRSLQRLRKRKLIAYSRVTSTSAGWRVT